MRRCPTLVGAIVAVLSIAGSVGAADVSYERDVWPIFRRHCWSCHTGEKPEGKLRLDTAEGLIRGGESGVLWQAGQPEKSLLIEMVSGDEPSMPPDPPGLRPEQVAILRRWIAEGGKVDRVPVDTTLEVVIPREYEFPPAITSVTFDPAGERVAVACRSEVVLVDLVRMNAPVRLATGSDLVNHVEFSPDGKHLAAVGGFPARYGEVRFFDASNGNVLRAARVSSDTLFRGSFAPDGSRIAVGAADGAVYLVPLDESAPIVKIDLHSDWVVDVAWTPDGKRLITGGRDKGTKVASVESAELLRSIDNAVERINAVTTDGKMAVSAGLARALTGYQLDVALQNVEVSGAGNGARPVSRRDQYLRPFEAPSGEVLDLAVSGDLKLLAVAGRFPEIRLYTLADLRRVPTAIRVPMPTNAVALNRDGTRLAVGGRDGKLEVFQLPEGKSILTTIPVPVRGAAEAQAAAAPR